MPSLAEFEKAYNEGGEAWNELTLRKGYQEALKTGEIEPFTGFDEYKAMVDGEGESGYNEINAEKIAEAWKKVDEFRETTDGLRPLGEAIPEKGDNQGTVAFIEVNGENIFGVNSSLLSDQDKNLGRRFFVEMQIDGVFKDVQRYGQGSSQVLTHAEGYALMQAYEKTGGNLGQTVIIYTDRATCAVCQKYLPALKEYMGIGCLIIVNKNGNIMKY